MITSDKSGEIKAEALAGLGASVADVGLGMMEREKQSAYSSGKMS